MGQKTKSSSDTSIENTSSNESLDNYTEAFGEISINSYSEFMIILFIKIGLMLIGINVICEVPFCK